MTTREYLLDSGTDLGREQLEHLEVLYDDRTVAAFDAVGVRPGQRCLDVGAGSGSITRRLADRVRPGGYVVAADIDTRRLAGTPGVDVRQHDINDGVPGAESYDLIHARLVLMHLRRRREIVTELIDALEPGGWLVLGELVGPPLAVLSAPTPADAELFHRVQEITCGVVGSSGGISYTWAREMDEHVVQAGLVNVHAVRHAQTTAGGSTGCLLHRNYNLQADPLLRAAGLTDSELEHYRALLLDPWFRTWCYEFVSVRGQKPTG